MSKYKALDEHYSNLDNIRKAKDNNTKLFYCLKDIEIVEQFKYEYTKNAMEEIEESLKNAEKYGLKPMSKKDQVELLKLPPSYGSFCQAAIIYEKEKFYDKAIEVCEQAIFRGFPSDGGTKNGMKERLESLKKKQAKQKGK